MLDKSIFLAYKGELNNKIVNTLLTGAKTQLKNLGMDLAIRKKIYNIMVECLENINRYSEDGTIEGEETKQHYPLFLVGKSDESFYVTVGNLIFNKDIGLLKQKLDDINNLSKEELKEKYRETILKADVSDSSGAGLGIIDMALKSENKLEYIFKTVENDVSFFILEIKI